MTKKRTSIKDIAKTLNISISTVSRALNDSGSISQQTKEKVKKQAEKLGYIPNTIGNLFRSNKSGLIAIILSDLKMFYNANLIKGVHQYFSNTDYTPVVFISNDNHIKESKIITECINKCVDGMMISCTNQSRVLRLLSNFNYHLPTIMIDKVIENDSIAQVSIDNFQTSYELTNKFIEKGHRHILAIFDDPNLYISKERTKGFKAAMKCKKYPIHDSTILHIQNPDQLNFYIQSENINFNAYTALYCMSDELFSYTLPHLQRQNIKIPQSLSVGIISDGIYPHMIFPKISHMLDSGYEIGFQASSMLYNHLNTHQKLEYTNKQLSTTWIDLDSIIPCKKTYPSKKVLI